MTRRVAWLSTETPNRDGGGGQRRQYFQVRALQRAGVEVAVMSMAGGQDDSSIRELAPTHRFRGRGRRWRAPMPGDDLRDLLQPGRFDVAVVAHMDSLPAVEEAVVGTGMPWALDFQNVYSRWHASRDEAAATRLMLGRETRALLRATMSTSVSTEERAALLAQVPGARVEVAGNGVAPDEWSQVQTSTPREPIVGMFASWIHPPNRSGLEWFTDAVWPQVRDRLPEARLVLLGPGDPPSSALAQPGVTYLGRVPSLEMAMSQVRVAVVPFVEGVGARVKFGESLASGAAVVSTRIGAEGYPTDTPFLLADHPTDFAAACCQLLENAEAARILGHQGRAFALEHLDWDQTSAPLVNFALREAG